MAFLTLTGFQTTGSFVSAGMFGANAVFQDTQGGRPTAAYQSAADALGVENIRFGGGQADLDPTRANAAGERPVDGESAINIVTMPGGALRGELVDFLDWCVARNAAGQPTETTLIIPTKHLSAEEYTGFAPQIATFVERVMQDYGDVIAAFQIGNEYWEMGETAYGIKASLAAEAIAQGLEAAGLRPSEQPDILVQMGTAGNQGSEFPATPGVSDFLARNTAANTQIIDQLSDRAIAAIDGVTEHYYYNGSSGDFTNLGTSVRNIDRDYAIWAERLGSDLDLYITEWNVKTTAQTLHGMVAGASMVKQFENMIAMGVDGAHVWALDYHSRTALTLDSDEGARLDGQGRLINAPQGAVFDLMSEALVGKELLDATFEGGMPGVSVTSYADAREVVFYVTSHSLETTSLRLDLTTGLPGAGPVRAVQVTMDAETSNGRQWVLGEAADSVTVEGAPYYYNEHDVDVLLKDMIFGDASQIDLTLKPFEVVELTVPYGARSKDSDPVADLPDKTPPDPGKEDKDSGKDQPGDVILSQKGDDLITGGAGRDTVVLSGNKDAYTLTLSPAQTLLTDRRPGEDGTDRLTDIETLQFADSRFDIDLHTGAVGLAEADFAAIVELYIAYFDRAPAAKGLLYWATRLADGMPLDKIAESFFVQPETQATYAPFLDGAGGLRDAQGFVTAVFNNVLGRDPSGPYWVNELDTNPAITPALFILAVLNGAKAVTGGAQDRAFLETKTDIGLYFAGVKGLSGYDDSVEVMDIYDGSAASLDKTLSHIDALYADARDPDEGSFLIELVGVIDDPFAAG